MQKLMHLGILPILVGSFGCIHAADEEVGAKALAPDNYQMSRCTDDSGTANLVSDAMDELLSISVSCLDCPMDEAFPLVVLQIIATGVATPPAFDGYAPGFGLSLKTTGTSEQGEFIGFVDYAAYSWNDNGPHQIQTPNGPYPWERAFSVRFTDHNSDHRLMLQNSNDCLRIWGTPHAVPGGSSVSMTEDFDSSVGATDPRGKLVLPQGPTGPWYVQLDNPSGEMEMGAFIFITPKGEIFARTPLPSQVSRTLTNQNNGS